MPRESPVQRRRRLAAASGITSLRSDFTYICQKHPYRLGIVSEGDSWFAYPSKWIIYGAYVNIIHHIEATIAFTDKVNLLRMASNGDEAVAMMAGKQKAIFEGVLSRNSEYINLILFSGGGNDIVGKRDMLELLNTYRPGYTAADCINKQRFQHKLDAIMLAYQQLVILRDNHTPKATVVTHSYDIAKPSKEGAEFFWGLIKTQPWIYPYLNQRNIPEPLHLDIVAILLHAFKNRLYAFTQQPENLGKIVMVDTQGILRPGNKADWLNEIHPTQNGFKKIAAPIYAQMQALAPSLPAWQ